MQLSAFLKNRVTLPRVFATLLALFLVLQFAFKADGFADLIFVVLSIVGIMLAFRLLRKSLWRLRNRLYVTWFFIGVVPFLLIFALAVVGTWMVSGQMAAYLVSSELQRRAESLATPARILSQAKPADRPGIVAQMGSLLAARMPGLEVVVSGNPPLLYPPDSAIAPPPQGWKDYTGCVLKDGVYYSAAIVKNGGVTVAALAPITADVLGNIVPGIGAARLGSGTEFAGVLPPPTPGWGRLDFEAPWLNRVPVLSWEDAQSADTEAENLIVTTRPSAVLRTVFSSGLDFAQYATLSFVALLVALLLVQIVSWVIGISLTRTVTGAVHGLYEGTQRIAAGDFAWRIPVKGNDQLAGLGRSFNNMTAQIERLVVVAKEKERLQSEVEIASDVQTQLFPRTAPAMRTIELVGLCHPARMVSGDYYDYLRLPDGNLAIAIGDVAGKGISAALLMASIQSIVRTQLAAGMPLAAAAGNGHGASRFSTSSLVAQLNRQLYASTSPEKYATFFFGAYDEQSRILTYTNAGHLQPLLLCGGEAKPLEVTGTVVGAFPAIRYEEQSVEVHSDDMLVAYTDGITEPENAYGEEFGAARLAETALRFQDREPKEIVAKIMEAVRQWSAAPELPDDMTLVIARGRA